MTGAGHGIATPLSPVQTIEDNVFSVEDPVGFQVCDPQLLGIVENAASFDANFAGSSADRLGRPVSRVLALYLCLAVQDVVLIAAVFNLLLVAMYSHHSKGDEAVWDTHRNGAAHLSAHWRLRGTSVRHAGSPLITGCFRWVTLIRPALAIHGGGSSNWLIVDNSSVSKWLGQRAIHRFAERWWIAPGTIV